MGKVRLPVNPIVGSRQPTRQFRPSYQVRKPLPARTYTLDSRAHACQVVRALERQFRLHRVGRSQCDAQYLDTFDWRLFAQQLALSASRVNGVVHLKLESLAGEVLGEVAAPELPTFSESLPPGQMRDRLAPIIEVRRLLERARDEAQVLSLRSVDARERTVVRLEVERHTLDIGGGADHLQPQASLRVRAVRGYPARYREVVDFVETALGLKATSRTPVATALASLRRRGCSSKLRLASDPDMTAGQAVRFILRRLLAKLRANEPGVRAQIDSEFLHDFRVALRQTRSALDFLREALPTEPLDYFRKEFKWLGERTGAVRDMDVFLLTLGEYRVALGGDHRRTLTPLEEHLHRSYGQMRRQMLAALDSDRYRELLRGWAEFLDADSPAPVSAVGQQPLAAFAAERIRWACRRTRKHGRAIDADSPSRALHRLRIDCKKLRYLLEFFASLYGADAVAGLVKPLKRLRDNLGTFNDLNVQENALLRFADELGAGSPVPVGCLLTMGQLVAMLRVRAQGERRRFDHRFAEFHRASRRARVQALLEGGRVGRGSGR